MSIFVNRKDITGGAGEPVENVSATVMLLIVHSRGNSVGAGHPAPTRYISVRPRISGTTNTARIARMVITTVGCTCGFAVPYLLYDSPFLTPDRACLNVNPVVP